MARTLYPKHGGFQFYSLAEWSLADNDAQNQTKPVAGDTILLTNSSAQVLCNEAWAAASLSHPGAGASEWQFSTQTAVVSGDITLDKVTATIEAADITAANFDLGAAGSLTMSDDLSLDGDFLLDGGTLTMAGNKLTVTGSYIKTSGTMVTPGTLEMTGTGNLSTATSNYPKRFVLGASSIITLTGNSRFQNGANIPSGAVLHLLGRTLALLYLSSSPPADPLYCEGAVDHTTTGNIDINANVNITNNAVVDFSSVPTAIRSNTGKSWAQTQVFTCGALSIRDSNNGSVQTVSIINLTAGIVTLGDAAALDRSGDLTLSGRCSIEGLVAGNATNTANAITFAGTTTITDAWDTSNIKTVNSSGIVTLTGGLTIDSTATNNTTWTLADDTTIIGDSTVQETAGVTTLNTNGNELTVKGDVEGADTPVITELLLRSIGITNAIDWPATVQPITELRIGRRTEITSTGGINATKIIPHTPIKVRGRGGWTAR